MTKAAERKRKERTNKRAQGYVLKQVWVKPENWDYIKAVIDSLKQNDR